MTRAAIRLIIVSLSFLSLSSYAQLAAHAGPDRTLCPGGSVAIGGTPSATGGQAPYSYSWSPSLYLSSSNTSNPNCTGAIYATYTLTVTDDTGAVATDIVVVSSYYVANVGAGNDTSICEHSQALLGADLNVSGMGVSYSWMPTTFLDNNTLPRPTCVNPTTSISYTLTASSASCPPLTDVVTVNLIPTPPIDAGPDVTIHEGEVATLHASGAFGYAWWAPPIMYGYTADPDVEPIDTTTYYVYGTDATKTCPATDSVRVFVIKSEELVIYNTFTPNNDGNNDTWYIGNIWKYPHNHVEIYNRNGRLVYKANAYINTWDGRAFGDELPEGTYFYVLDLGDGKGTKNGTVTIIK
ncbi:MAG: gliding motility-associated C-terminal domain-containing protein [Bacteroidia bacterium]